MLASAQWMYSFTRRKAKTLSRLRNEDTVHFEYPGDDGSRVVSWFKEHLRAIGTCVNGGLPEASLTLLYSGIDTFGWLAAPPGVVDASHETYKQWCDKYIVPRLTSVEGDPVTAVDLLAARCGVLHTCTPLSKRGRAGKAHEIWYQFLGRAGMNLIMDPELKTLGLDIENLAMAFKEGGLAFLADLKQDQTGLQNAEARAQHFLRWGKVSF